MKGAMFNRVLHVLGYETSRGYVPSTRFAEIPHARRTLLAAAQMGVQGCFGIWTYPGSPTTRRFFPLVYVAVSPDEDVTAIHRSVWNQSVVPFLLVLTPTAIVACDGFSFSRARDGSVHRGERFRIALSEVGDTIPAALSPYESRSLESSLAWRDRAVDVTGRVDHRLLENIANLIQVLTGPRNPVRERYRAKKLPVSLARGLIGRFIYLNFLTDRKIITPQWYKRHGLSWRPSEPDSISDTRAFRALWRALDDTFNGSIFPFSADDWAKIRPGHLALVQAVMRETDLYSTASMQSRFGFAEFDFTSLRIETLSAVYEQFLHGTGLGEDLGAYYTPPFLADYILDALEAESGPLTAKHKVLDCAAGSGVFLVTAFRRIIESTLATGEHYLPVAELRRILSSCIYGIELEPDACHVASFSLYLTMLDYAAPSELEKLERTHRGRAIFPTLSQRNLIAHNFFSTDRRRWTSIPSCFDFVISNPPWKPIEKDTHAPAYCAQKEPLRSVGDGQIADLFLWKALDHHLKPGGYCAMVMPGKSFVNSTGRKFRAELFHEKQVLGLADFSNLRHVLFARAIHPPAVVFVKNSRPEAVSKVWHYAPLRATQIGASGRDQTHQTMWALLVDPSEKRTLDYQDILDNPDLWSALVHVRDVDRNILNYLRDLGDQAGFSSFLRLSNAGLISFKRGGNQKDTGVTSRYILTAKKENDATYFRHYLGAVDSGFFPMSTLPNGPVPLPPNARPKVGYRQMFAGNIVLVPRMLRDIQYVEPPIAYNSSFIGIYSESPSAQPLLRALVRILRSKVAQYYLKLSAPRYLIDRPNIEPSALNHFSLPFAGVDDSTVAQINALPESQVDDWLFEAYGIRGAHKDAVLEFIDVRIQLKDGGIPAQVHSAVSDGQTARYSEVVSEQLNRLVTGMGCYKVYVRPVKEEGLGIVCTRFIENGAQTKNSDEPAYAAAIKGLSDEGFSTASTSLVVQRAGFEGPVFLAKPLQFLNWTTERAIHDARVIARSAHIEQDRIGHWHVVS